MGPRGAGLLLAAALAGCGGEHEAATPPAPRAPTLIHITSPSFANGARLPRALSCDGAGRPPALKWSGVPSGARELVLAVEDPDAGGTFVHWTVFGLPASTRGLPAGGALPVGARTGRNTAGDDSWTPPCPPHGDGPHRYVFTLYALRKPSGLKAGAEPDAVRAALSRGALARGTLRGTYRR